MRIVTRLNLLFLLMLGVGTVAAGLSLWNAERTSFHVERIDLAHRSLEAHLQLSSHTYQLFKQYGDALILGDLDTAGIRTLVAAVRADIDTIRQIIGEEIELVGEEEIEELTLLAETERTIEQLIVAFEARASGGTPETFSADWRALSLMLEDDIDRTFHAMIDAALEEEREEVRETTEAFARELTSLRVASLGAALLAMLAMAVGVWMLQRRLSRPLARLMSGVRAFGDGGRRYRRLELRGRDELAELARAFDTMAERIVADTERLSNENSSLESAVAERTEQLGNMLETAHRGEANRRRLLADVSHELRTPLTIIQGEADVALRGVEKPPEVYRDALTRTREAARHTARLVEDLLFIARSEEGIVPLRLEELELATLARDTIRTIGREVAIEFDGGSAPMRGDPARIRQALLVLLENAHHHGGEHVVVRLNRSVLGWRIAVEDDGAGLSDEDKEKAFERFYRGSGAAGRYADGAGLGLPIVRAIARSHGGETTLADRPGGGLIATIELPGRVPLRVVG